MTLLLLILAKSASISWAAFPPATLYSSPKGTVGCSQMTEDFCKALWLPKNLGNIDLKVGAKREQIREGRLPNEFGFSLYNYLKARLLARSRLPEEFRTRLEARGFFPKLQAVMNKKPNRKLSVKEKERERYLGKEVETIWDNSIDEVVFSKMNIEKKDFFQLTNDNIPHSLWLKYNEFRDRLEASIVKSIWSGNEAWQHAAEEFQSIRTAFIELIESHTAFSSDIKKEWISRLKSVELVIPGSDPLVWDLMDKGCASTTENAFYLPTHNKITICGGYLVGVNLIRTIAHELSHALAVRRTIYQYKVTTEAHALVSDLVDRTCKQQPLSCDEWGSWKKKFEKASDKLETVSIPNQEFLACFRKKELKAKRPEKEFLEYVSKERVSDVLEYSARRSWFLQLTKDKEILRDGTEHANPRYLNPCGFMWNMPKWERLTNPFAVSSFFVNDYLCQKKSNPDEKPEVILERAVETAKNLSTPLMQKELLVPGVFASDREFERQGYSEDVEEDFADYLSGEVVAKLLEKLPQVEDRRSLVLASIAHLCDEPSIERQYPDEAAVQKKYYFDPHSEGVERRQRLLTAPIREALQCSRDFKPSIKECDWTGKPLKQ